MYRVRSWDWCSVWLVLVGVVVLRVAWCGAWLVLFAVVCWCCSLLLCIVDLGLLMRCVVVCCLLFVCCGWSCCWL